MSALNRSGVNVDFYGVEDYLGEEDRALVAKVRAFVDSEVTPIINEYWEQADFPYQILPKFGELGIIGTAIEGYGWSPWSSPAVTGASTRSTPCTPASRWGRSTYSAATNRSSAG